jgi:hypothetical protein
LPQLRSLDLTHSSVKTLPPEWLDEAYPNYGEGAQEQYKTAMQAIEVDLLFEQGKLVRELSEKERTLVGL